jgi:hypothetical protein
VKLQSAALLQRTFTAAPVLLAVHWEPSSHCAPVMVPKVPLHWAPSSQASVPLPTVLKAQLPAWHWNSQPLVQEHAVALGQLQPWPLVQIACARALEPGRISRTTTRATEVRTATSKVALGLAGRTVGRWTTVSDGGQR